MSTLTCSWLHCLLEHEDLGPRVFQRLIKTRWTLTDDADDIQLCARLLCTSRSVCRATQPRVPSLLHWFGERDVAVTGMRMHNGERIVTKDKLALMFDQQGTDLEYACSPIYCKSRVTGAHLVHELRWTGPDNHFGDTYTLRPRHAGVHGKDRLYVCKSRVYGDHLLGPTSVVVRKGAMGAFERTTTMAIAVSTNSAFARWLLAHECKCDLTRVSGMVRSKALVRFVQSKRKRGS